MRNLFLIYGSTVYIQLYEDWKKFKANKRMKQNDLRLMSEFIKITAPSQD